MLKTEGYENSQLFMALTPKNGVKASKLYSYKPIDGTGDFHWSRNHTAYRLNQEGVLELMGNNVPRVDYTNTCPELLIEKASTNLVQHSQQIDDAYWTKLNSTVVANSTTAPDGTTTADTLVGNNYSGNDILYGRTGIGVTNGDKYTHSVYAKKKDYDWVILYGVGAQVAWFNINTGVVGSISGTATSEIQNIGNGWYRLSITVLSSSTSGIFYHGPVNANGSLTATSDGTKGTYWWGNQLELGDYATSYIPTTNATQTRPKDVAYNTANGYNDADWSVIMRVRLNNIGSSADEPLLALSDGTTDYYFAIYTDSNPKLHFTWYNNPDQDTYSTSDLSNGIVNVGVSFDSVTAEYIIVIDGTMEFAGTLVNNAPGLFGNFNRLDLGSIFGTGSPDRDGIIGIQYYDSALTQSDLENLTA